MIANSLLTAVADFASNAAAVCEGRGFGLADAREMEANMDIAAGVVGGKLALAYKIAEVITEVAESELAAASVENFVRIVRDGELPLQLRSEQVDRLSAVLRDSVTEENASALYQCYRNIFRLSRGLLRVPRN